MLSRSEAIEVREEEDGHWVASLPDFSDVLVHGATRHEALANLLSLVFRSVVDRVAEGEGLEDAVSAVVSAALPLVERLPEFSAEEDAEDLAAYDAWVAEGRPTVSHEEMKRRLDL